MFNEVKGVHVNSVAEDMAYMDAGLLDGCDTVMLVMTATMRFLQQQYCPLQHNCPSLRKNCRRRNSHHQLHSGASDSTVVCPDGRFHHCPSQGFSWPSLPPSDPQINRPIMQRTFHRMPATDDSSSLPTVGSEILQLCLLPQYRKADFAYPYTFTPGRVRENLPTVHQTQQTYQGLCLPRLCCYVSINTYGARKLLWSEGVVLRDVWLRGCFGSEC